MSFHTFPIELDLINFLVGLQKDNVTNQRENLILLLANVHIRQIPKPEPQHKVPCDFFGWHTLGQIKN